MTSTCFYKYTYRYIGKGVNMSYVMKPYITHVNLETLWPFYDRYLQQAEMMFGQVRRDFFYHCEWEKLILLQNKKINDNL